MKEYVTGNDCDTKDFDAFADLHTDEDSKQNAVEKTQVSSNEENPCEGMTWPFVGDVNSLQKPCAHAVSSRCVGMFRIRSVEIKDRVLRQATKEAAMDERFEDALCLKKERIELESKVEAFSEAETRWRGMPTYHSTMYHLASRELRRQSERSWTTLRIFASLF